jgi:hypothetical protein
MALTQTQIITLIDEIQAGADYPATKMNPLLNDILTAAYGPLYIGSVPPSNTNDETGGYRPGSVGYDTLTKRYYVCQSALAGNAVWILIPADSSYQVAAYTTIAQQVVCSVNTTVVKCTNDSVGGNLGCSLKLPANPYIGRTVLVYFDDSIITFTVRDSSGTAVVGAISLTIPAGQQYTFTYSGTAWEIVGVNNTTAGSPSGVNVKEEGTVVTTDTTFLNFIGPTVTVTNSGSGSDVTISANSGVDVQDAGSTVKAAAQFVNFTGTNLVATANGLGADVAVNPTITVRKNNVIVSSICNEIRFNGSIYETVSGGSAVVVSSNGPKSWLGTVNAIPGANDDSTAGYSNGSVGYNEGNLRRVYVCHDNTTAAAVWKQVSQDYKTQQISIVNAGTYPLDFNTAFVKLLGSATISTVTITATPYPYEGKTLTVYATTTVGTINQVSLSTLSGTITVVTTGAKIASITFVCVNAALNQWIEIARSIV